MGRKPVASRIVENLVQRVFASQSRNILWVGDTTYIPLQSGFLYLTTFIVVCSRKVMGWAMKTRMTEQLVIDAFLQTVGREQPPVSLIVYTDRGSQYTNRRYQEVMTRHGDVISMSRLGDPYNNALMESFYKTLKSELLAGGKFVSAHEAEKAVFEYIEMFYNT